MKHRLNPSVRKAAALCLLLAVVCMTCSSCSFSFSFSLEDMLTELKAYINGTEVAQPPADFVESKENEEYAYDVYLDHIVITAYLGTETTVVIPAKIDMLPVRKLAGLTFYESVAVESVTVPEGVTELEENTFYYCGALKSVSLPESLTAMGDKTFSWCSSLEEVIVGEGLTTVGRNAFVYCSALRKINIPATATVSPDAFEGCTPLE